MAKKKAEPDMYVLKLDFKDYIDFAQWMTKDVGDGIRRYELPPGKLNAKIEKKLRSYPAKVHEFCDDQYSPREFGKDCDRVVTYRDCLVTQQDPNSAQICLTNMALPDKICLDADGNIDLKYLIDYVEDLCNAPREDAAWALLGMYFLSRCK